ncbi:unnamed protein product [Clavelina lepadiformis]|uniref:Uncharacterized protein n=1 Tax=Clavelina lepadiformis TaxID=159417 RepID=A0ABP0GDU6_CLALP
MNETGNSCLFLLQSSWHELCLGSSMYLTSVHLGAAKFVFSNLDKVKRLCSEGKTNLASFKKEPTRKHYVKAAMKDLTEKAQKVSSPSPRKRSIAEIIAGISTNEDNFSRGSAKNKQAKQSITVHAVEVSSDSEVEEVQQNASQSSSSVSVTKSLTTSSQRGTTDNVQNSKRRVKKANRRCRKTLSFQKGKEKATQALTKKT